jgi:hypothetical protein
VHRVFYTLQWFFPGQVVAGVQTARGQVPQGVTNCTITNTQVSAGTTSSAASTFNVQRCTGAGPSCSTTANLYTTAPTLAASTESAAGGAPNTATIAGGDVFRVNLASVGSGLSDVSVEMTYKCEDTN